jgi:hypothetical protein
MRTCWWGEKTVETMNVGLFQSSASGWNPERFTATGEREATRRGLLYHERCNVSGPLSFEEAAMRPVAGDDGS